MGLKALLKRTPNHLRLVGECYPASKTAVEPDGNALGRLTFYTRQRPVKLDKVGKALLRRSQKTSETVAHLCVTLAILKKLLDECRADVAVFGKEAMAVIDLAFKRGQAASRASQTDPHTLLELYEKTAGANRSKLTLRSSYALKITQFYALATFSLAPVLDETAYVNLLRQFCQLVHDDKTMQLRLVGVHAIEGAVTSELFHQLDFEEQAHLVVPTLLFALMDTKLDPRTLDDNKASTSAPNVNFSTHSSAGPLRPSLQDRRARSIRIAKGLEGTEKPPSRDDAAKSAYNTLRAAFRLAQPRHIENYMAETATYFDTRPQETWGHAKWCCWLAGRCTEWTQAQYRFAIIKYWLDELDGSARQQTENSEAQIQRQETILTILIDQLSSPTTSVVNLALSDVLATLVEQVIKTPHKPALKQGILALSSHIYYPEQINDLVGDLLAAVLDLSGSGASPRSETRAVSTHEDAKVTLLQCSREMVANTSGSGFKVSGEQMHASLGILNDPSQRVRLAYLAFVQSVFENSGSAKSSSSTSAVPATSSKTHTHAAIPAIKVESSPATATSPGSMHMDSSARFARDLQLRLFSASTSAHAEGLPGDEMEAIIRVLDTIYAKKEGQQVLEGVPILTSWKNAETSSGVIKTLISRAYQTIAQTWAVQDNSTPDSLDTASLASSPSLQAATLLSEQNLLERLSQPYTLSPLTGRTSISHGHAHSNHIFKKPRSIGHGSSGGDHASQHEGNTASRRHSRPSSIFTTSLADLKQSLVGGWGGQGAASAGYPGNGHNGSPSRSITGNSTAASSFAEHGSMTPPNGLTNGHISHLSPKSIPESIRTGGGAGAQHTRKPRLDRIIGSADDGSWNNQNGNGHPPIKIRSPPYQLS